MSPIWRRIDNNYYFSPPRLQIHYTLYTKQSSFTPNYRHQQIGPLWPYVPYFFLQPIANSMMKLLAACCAVSLFVAVSASNQVESFCSRWFPNSHNCVEESIASAAVNENLNVVNDRSVSGDQSVCLSYYLHYTQQFFENNMVMSSDPLPVSSGSSRAVNHCSVSSVNRSYSKLDTMSLPDSVTRFVSYRVSAALSLMYIRFKQSDPSFDVSFSVDMVNNLLGEHASAQEIFTFLKDHGVCSSEDYTTEVEAGRSRDPRCCVYKLSSFTRVKTGNSCELAQVVKDRDLYVEMALNPYSFQLSCLNSSAPVSHAYYRYTVAGVVHGFNAESSQKYWNVYVLRHGAENSNLKVRLEWDRVFAAMSGHVYDVETDLDSISNRQTISGELCVVPTTAVPLPTPGSGDPCGSTFWNSLQKATDLVNVTRPEELYGMPIRSATHLFIKDFPRNRHIDLALMAPLLKYICINHFIAKCSNVFTLGKQGYHSMTAVEGLYIGDYSLTKHDPGTLPEKEDYSSFSILNMPNLKEVVIGQGSFGSYDAFNIGYLPKLTKLQVGVVNPSTDFHSDNFYWVRQQFSVNSINRNAQIVIGNYAFNHVSASKKSIMNSNTSYGYGSFTA